MSHAVRRTLAMPAKREHFSGRVFARGCPRRGTDDALARKARDLAQALAGPAAVRPPTRILRAVRSEVGVEPQAPPPLSPGQLAITGSQVVLEPAVNNAHAPVWSNCALIFSRVCWISISVPP